MITRGGLFHQPKSNYSYGYDGNTLHLRFRALKGEVKKAYCRIGDPFVWKNGGAGGNLEASGGASGWESHNLTMIKEVTTEYHDYFFVEVKGLSKRSRYAFILEDKDEMIVFGERRILNLDKGLDDPYLSDLGNFYCFPYLNEIDVLKSPTWVKKTLYGIRYSLTVLPMVTKKMTQKALTNGGGQSPTTGGVTLVAISKESLTTWIIWLTLVSQAYIFVLCSKVIRTTNTKPQTTCALTQPLAAMNSLSSSYR